MPFPESPRVVFDNNPLTQVTAQLRFPPILRIGAEDPAPFQDRVRGEYPLYRRQGATSDLPPQVAGLVQQLQVGVAIDNPSHVFSTEDGSRSLALTREFIAVETEKYRRWDEFGAKIEEAKRALEDIYQPSFYGRIGLRYVDVIDRQALGLDNAPWASLINPDLIGLLAAQPISDEVTEIQSVATITIAAVEGGSVRLRQGLRRRQPEQGDLRNVVYVVDADFSTNKRSTTDDVTAILNVFNRVAGNLFRWAITDRLRTALRPRAVD